MSIRNELAHPDKQEIVHTSEVLDFHYAAETLHKHLLDSETPAYRVTAKHTIYDYESPLHMPDAINRYREVGVPISNISVALDICQDKVEWSIDVDLASLDESFRKSFCISGDEEGVYHLTDENGEQTPVSQAELARLLVDLTLSQHERKYHFEKGRSIVLESLDPVSAGLIHQTLANRPTVVSSISSYYDISSHVSLPQDVELIVEKNDISERYRVEVLADGQDGMVTHVMQYGVEINVAKPTVPGAQPAYSLEVLGSRMIDIGDGKLIADDEPPRDAIVPHAIVTLANICYLFGADLPKTAAVAPDELLQVLDDADASY